MPAPGQRSITVNEDFYKHLKNEAAKSGKSIAQFLEALDKLRHGRNNLKEIAV